MSDESRAAVCDVVVIGAGPVGAMTALRCAQRGLSVIAIDRAVGVFPLPRAVGLDHEGQRLFAAAGVGHLVDEFSSPTAGAEFLRADGERVVGFDLPEGFVTPLGYPPMVMFHQPSIDGGLRRACLTAGVDLRLGVEATGIDGTTVMTSMGAITARWIVGADGAGSWTRRQIGVGLEDQGFEQEWLVVDATLDQPNSGLSRLAQQWCDPERVVTFVPGHANRLRWEFQLRPGETSDEMITPGRVRALLDAWGAPAQLEIERSAVYRFHGLVAERYRAGPVFLVGDAAHQMPPFNGQGMNSGLRDADNLAWKLALVADDLAGDGVLDTYERERRPHAVGCVAHSCDAGRLIDDIAAGIDVSPDAGYGGGRPFPYLVDGVVDGDHPMVGRPVVWSSDKTIDAVLGSGFAVVGEHSGELPAAWRALGARAVAAAHAPIPIAPDEFVVVRPDRYVAAVTTDLAGTTSRLLARMATEVN